LPFLQIFFRNKQYFIEPGLWPQGCKNLHL